MPSPIVEDRICEGRRPRPFEAHARIASDVDEERPAPKELYLVIRDEDQRGVGVLEGAVDDDVVLGKELGDGLVLAVELECLTGVIRVPLEGGHAHRVDRRRDGRDLTPG